MLKFSPLLLSLVITISSGLTMDIPDHQLKAPCATCGHQMSEGEKSIVTAERAHKEWVALYQQESKDQFIQRFIDTGGGRTIDGFDKYTVLGINEINEETVKTLNEQKLCFLLILENLAPTLSNAAGNHVFNQLTTLNGNSPYVQFSLYVCHKTGIGCIKNLKTAYGYLSSAATQYGLAKYYQGKLKETGQEGKEPIEKDPEAAFQLYNSAAGQGVWSAYNSLGRYYENKGEDPENVSLATQNYRKAAERGYPFAQYTLGKNYREGNGVTKDRKISWIWIGLAALGGHEQAKQKIEGFNSEPIASVVPKRKLDDSDEDRKHKKPRTGDQQDKVQQELSALCGEVQDLKGQVQKLIELVTNLKKEGAN